MRNLIEISQDYYGYNIQVTLYKADDTTSAENLSAASTVSLDITRQDETVLVSNAAVTITTAASGIVTFTPAASWFSSTNTRGQTYFNAIFKINYTSGVKRSFKVPMYVHRR